MPRRLIARRRGRIEARLPEELRAVLRQTMRDLDEMLDTDGAAAGRAEPADPLEAITGITGSAERERPDDPALLRLRPDAYAAEVDEGRAAGEYRRLTEADLENLQRARVAVVLDGLSATDPIALTDDDAEAWLGALNDARLVVASRLGIETDEWEPGPGTPESLLYLYELLGLLFAETLDAVAG